MKTLYGWIASTITLIYKLPQIYKLYKRKKSNDISVLSLLVQSVGYIFYILHGITVNDSPIVLMGSGALLETVILVIMYFYYSKTSNPNVIENT